MESHIRVFRRPSGHRRWPKADPARALRSVFLCVPLRSPRLCGELLAAILFLASAAHAERKYTFGTQFDILGGLNNRVGDSSTTITNSMKPFYGAVPTFQLKSEGRRSTLDLSYSSVLEQFRADQRVNSVSHVVDTELTLQPSGGTRLRLSESFFTAPYFSVLNLPGETISTAEGFRYTFDPVLAKQSTTNNHARASLEVDTGARSFLTFEAGASLRYYEPIAETSLRYNDQRRYEGSLAYNRRVTARHNWNLRYSAVYNDVDAYGIALTHNATLGYTGQVHRIVRLRLEAGPAYTESRTLNLERWGYRADAGLTVTGRRDEFSLSYSHRSGDASGLGSISDTDRAGIGYAHAFGRFVLYRMDASAFETRGRFENPYDGRGLQGASTLAFLLGERWALLLGGSYMRQMRSQPDTLEYKRLYVALRFNAPELWRFAK